MILGNLDGIEAGVRQMIRTVPLEVARVDLPSGAELTVPTAEETLRIKAFLAVRRNQTRDYLDLAALSERLGVPPIAPSRRSLLTGACTGAGVAGKLSPRSLEKWPSGW